MHLDVLDLRAFYYRTPLGRSAQRLLQEATRGLWPDTRGLCDRRLRLRRRRCSAPSSPTPPASLALMPGPQGVMPWPAGEPNRCVLCRGDPLADRGRHRRPADRRPRPRDQRQPRGAPRRDLARPRPRRPRHLHRPQPLRPLGAPRRHPLRLRPPLQPRPAREPAAHPPLRARAPRRRSLRAPLAPQVPAADRLLLGAPRPPLRAPRHRRRAPRRGLEAGLRPPALLRLQGRGARPARRPRRPHPPKPGARPRPRPPRPRLRAARADRFRRRVLRAAPAYCHAPDPLLSATRFRRGTQG